LGEGWGEGISDKSKTLSPTLSQWEGRIGVCRSSATNENL